MKIVNVLNITWQQKNRVIETIGLLVKDTFMRGMLQSNLHVLYETELRLQQDNINSAYAVV